MICERFGLHGARISSQVIQRDRHANYVATLAVIASHAGPHCHRSSSPAENGSPRGGGVLQRKAKGIVGHAAQTQSRNLRTDQRTGARGASNVQAAYEDVALWHERDISHSSVERVILPDSTILLDYLLYKTTNLMDTLLVYPERMQRNLDSTGGLVFSGHCCSTWSSRSGSREGRLPIVQRDAMRAWKERRLPRNGAERS